MSQRIALLLLVMLTVTALSACAGPRSAGKESLTLEAEDVIVDPATGDVAPKVEAGISIPLRGTNKND